MIKRIFDKIDKSNNRFGFILMKDEFKNQILTDVNKLCFLHFYAQIMVDLSEYVEFENTKEIQTLKKLLENPPNMSSNIEEVTTWKSTVNGAYGILHRNNKEYANIVSNYAYEVIMELFDNNPNIFYVDTDTIYYKGEINLLDIDLKFYKRKLKYFFVESKKKIISYYDNGETKIVGYWNDKRKIKIGEQTLSPNDVINIMTAKNREEQINNIFK